MITDKIKFKPGYAKADSKTFASAGVEVEGLDPQIIWRICKRGRCRCPEQ